MNWLRISQVFCVHFSLYSAWYFSSVNIYKHTVFALELLTS